MTEIDVLEKYGGRHWYLISKRRLIHQHISNKGKILVIGVGAGYLLQELDKRDFEVYGIDIDSKAIKYTKDKGCKTLILANALTIPFHDKCFDYVVASDVLEHIKNAGIVLNEIKRVMKGNAKFIFTVPAKENLWSIHDIKLGHVKRYEKNNLKKILENHNFIIEKLQFWNSFLYPIIYMQRRLNKSIHHDLYKSDRWYMNWLMPLILNIESKISFIPFGTTLFGVVRKEM